MTTSGRLRSITDLSTTKDARDFFQHHREVVSYWRPKMSSRQRAADLVRGKIWTAAEHKEAKKRNKNLLEINTLKPQERTILGLMLQNKYDVKFAPREPTDQPMSQIYEQLREWDSFTQEDDHKDVDLLRNGWGLGAGYQECWMMTGPGQRPSMRTANVNPFAVYPDPNSCIPITRTDARFIDIVSWV